MDSVKVSTILQDVRVILDQNAEGFDVPGVGEYTLEMNDVIKKSIVPAVQWAHMNAPVTKLKGVDFLEDAGLEGNALKLPGDFMRLVTIRVDRWKRALSTYLLEDDPQVSQILSGYPGLMPTADKPSMVLRQEDGDNYLLLYPFEADDDSSDDSSSDVTEGDLVVSARYIPFPEIKDESDSSDEGETVDIEPAVYRAFLYYLAHLVKLSYNEESKFEEQAKTML